MLARENAMRNPRRTAATASALMIGLALVTMFSVLGQSAKASVTQSIRQQFLGNYVVKTTGASFGDFSPTVEPKIAAVPGVEAISPERAGNAALRLVQCGPHRGRRAPPSASCSASTSRAAACRRWPEARSWSSSTRPAPRA